MKKSKFQNKNILVSFRYAFEGLYSALKTERNLRIDVCSMIFVTIAGVIFKISTVEFALLIALCFMVISAEVINTVLEIVVDMITDEIKPQAKLAKDLAAASVLILAFASVIVGCFIFVPKIAILF